MLLGILINGLVSTLQSDIQTSTADGKLSYVGFADVGLASAHRNAVTDADTVKLGTHVLQFVFVGVSGFRFPVAHYPTNGASCLDLNQEVWTIVEELEQWGFNVRMEMHFFGFKEMDDFFFLFHDTLRRSLLTGIRC